MCKVLNARQAPKPAADRVYVGRPSKWGMSGRPSRGKEILTLNELVGCSHVSGLLTRHI